MHTNPTSLNIDEIIAALPTLDGNDRMRLQSALFEFQNDLDLREALNENLDTIKGRVTQE